MDLKGKAQLWRVALAVLLSFAITGPVACDALGLPLALGRQSARATLLLDSSRSAKVQTHNHHTSRGTMLQMQGWEGDDLRWITRVRRRIRRRGGLGIGGQKVPVRRAKGEVSAKLVELPFL